ncbi:MarR family winged helix-turn-helix transcriptional regulator [Thomasclavelia cocleata]|uniref:MarR family winged helix-turn-helix transcriptional regulator n=1 Tax=Thomasclavelia cocleata TaxID=69824 RepID=UPI0025889731|nr:MarR family transcriptional regulator [Thomasclavelia cocleata]
MKHKKTVDNLIRLLPYWHYKIEKPLKQTQKYSKISYESYFCLTTLCQYGPLTMSEIAKRLKLSKQQATQLIDKLYSVQFVDRVLDKNDRRKILISPTDNAKEFLKTSHFDGTVLDLQIETNLSLLEQKEFYEATEIMLKLLSKFK